MLASDIPPRLDSEGYIFLDANGDMFHHILHFLRNDTFDLPSNFHHINALKSTINYFNLPEMMARLEKWTAPAVLSKEKILEIVAKKGDELDRWDHSQRWINVKKEDEEVFTSVLTDDEGKHSSRVVHSERDTLFGSYKRFCKVVSSDKFYSHSNVMAVLIVTHTHTHIHTHTHTHTQEKTLDQKTPVWINS